MPFRLLLLNVITCLHFINLFLLNGTVKKLSLVEGMNVVIAFNYLKANLSYMPKPATSSVSIYAHLLRSSSLRRPPSSALEICPRVRMS